MFAIASMSLAISSMQAITVKDFMIESDENLDRVDCELVTLAFEKKASSVRPQQTREARDLVRGVYELRDRLLRVLDTARAVSGEGKLGPKY
jgi:hypothetical protein